MNVYYDPEKFGLTTVAQLDYGIASWDFDFTVVWQRNEDGAFLYGHDSGCSCPSPFESQGLDDLTVFTTLDELRKHISSTESEYAKADPNDVAALIEKLHGMGLR